MGSYCLTNNLGTRMLEVHVKRSWIFLIICFVFMLSLIILTSPLLKLLGEISNMAALTGAVVLLAGLLGNSVFHWCPQVCSKKVTVPISVVASSADEVADNPSPPQTNYEVFISFRGQDTRDNFTSHLHDALCKKKIKTFIDNKLNRGDEISSTLLQAIEGSEIFVVIFSKDYASSTWCLDELVKILECKERYGRLVIPIFYNIDPSNVRRQIGSYANSFVKHAKRFQNNMNKVNNWKAALIQVSNLSGLDSTKIRPEPKLIGKIVEDILRKLKRNFSYDLEGLVGIQDHISVVESFLNIGMQDVRIVGIWGMGGIGKTTIAEAIFHKLNAQFESCSFVLSVQEQLRTTGLDHIRDKYLHELLEEEDIGTHSFRSLFVKKLLHQKKVLLVIDDVSKLTQMENLIRGRDWFGPGSRIIITTRDMQVLRTANADEIYHVKKMRFNNALQLFCERAFRQDLPLKNYVEISEEAVNYCKGIPLALKVLGSFLYTRTEQEWKSSLKKLQNAPHMEIFYVLKLSFDGLDDDQKEMFLDIALFYERIKIGDVMELLVSCGFFADIGISILVDGSLISIRNDLIIMHELIRAMGREIACQPNLYNSRQGRRLWKHEEVYHVFKINKEIEDIHGLSLDVSKIKEIYLRSNMFEDMDNLKILKFYNSQCHHNSRLHIHDDLRNLPEEIRYFQWDGYPHRCVPLNSCAHNIVELYMINSRMKQLWDGNQHLPNLKIINLGGSDHLNEIPDLSGAPNIRLIDLRGCKCLSQVYSSIFLPNLRSLLVNHCDTLKTVNIGGNKLDKRRWRLLANYDLFIWNRYISGKVSMMIFKAESSNAFTFRFDFVSVPESAVSESMDDDSAVLACLHATLKSALPNLKLLRVLDNPSSLGSLSTLLVLRLDYLSNLDLTGRKGILRTIPVLEETKSLCSPCMEGRRNEVMLSSWDSGDLIVEHDN